ncbi:MAG: hypothetical protein J6M62_05030 [Selenomonadaceae bacterium]|nr:hypothetical protein [Selenomonadaceae bacterium]
MKMSRSWEDVEKELFTPEEIQESEFKARFLDTILKSYDNSDLKISRERLAEITIEFLEHLKIKEPAFV